jgi:hypothetical protein
MIMCNGINIWLVWYIRVIIYRDWIYLIIRLLVQDLVRYVKLLSNRKVWSW